MAHSCRCCGRHGPDVGYVSPDEVTGLPGADLLCDDCTEALQGHLARLVWEGFQADRACLAAERVSDQERARAAHLRHMHGELY